MMGTFDLSEEMMRSKPRCLLRCGSRMMPKGCQPANIMRRIFSQFSPTPPASTMASVPDISAKDWPMNFFTRVEYIS